MAEVKAMDAWMRLFRSHNPAVRKRAAQGLLRHGELIPLPVLLEIFDELSEEGLGAAAERVLMKRRDPDLFDEMVLRLESPLQFIREVACWVLRELGHQRATPELLARLDDRSVMVRKAAVCALAQLRDPASGPPLLHHYETHSEDINVRWALEDALDALGVSYQRRT